MSRRLTKFLLTNPSIPQLTAKRATLLRTIKGPINYRTEKGHDIKILEEQLLKANVNALRTTFTKQNKKKNHLKGGKTRRQRGTR
jgi:hypothetical protein